MGKSKIKGITIAFCKELVAKRRGLRGLLSNLAQHLKPKVDNGVMSCIAPYKNTLSEIARIDHEAAKGAQVRARVQWVEEGETSSAFFFRLGKKQMACMWVSALGGSDGVVYSDMDGIRRVLSSFYFRPSFLDLLLVVSFNRIFRQYLPNSCIPTFCTPLTLPHIVSLSSFLSLALCIGLVLGGNCFSSILIARSLTWPGRLLMVFYILRAGLLPSASRSPWLAFMVLLVKVCFTCSSIALLPSPSFPGFNH